MSLDTEVKETKVVKTTEDVMDLSLESKEEKRDLDQHFSAEDHEKLITLLSTVDFNAVDAKGKRLFSDKVYLVPKEYLTSSDDDKSFVAKVPLDSKEAQEFIVPTKCAMISSLVRRTLAKEQGATEVPLPQVSCEALRWIVRYMIHQDGVPGQIPQDPITSKKMSDIVKDSWVAKLMDDLTPDLNPDTKDSSKIAYESYSQERKDAVPKTRDLLWDIHTSANYMEMNCLLHIVCAKSASIIKGTPGEKIKGLLLGTFEVEVKPKKTEKVEEKGEEKGEEKE
jgi:hypothetical protein